MKPISRRALVKYGAAAIGLPALQGGRAFAQGAPLKIGMVLVSPVSETGWTRQHETARAAVIATFGSRVTTTVIENITGGPDADRVFTELASRGHELVFGTSFSHMSAMAKTAREFPGVKFEHCSGLKRDTNLGTFEAKYFEGGYMGGMAAAAVSKSKVIGFVGGFPIPDVLATINAIVLGARSIRPDIICKVVWLNSWFDPGRERDAANALMAGGADVLVAMTDTPATVQAAEARGAWSVGYASNLQKFAPKGQLTSITLDWSGVYIDAVKSVLEKRWTAGDRWDGISAGVVKMAPYHPAIPAPALAAIRTQETLFAAGTARLFAGPVRDWKGKERVARGAFLADDAIRKTDWMIEGVNGTL